MRKKLFYLIVLSLFLILAEQNVYANFQLNVTGNDVLVVGRSIIFNVYIKNTGATSDNYTITPTVEYYYPPGNDLSHIIKVHLISDKIENLEPGRTGFTQGTITILAEIFDPPGGIITFTTESDKGDPDQIAVLQISGSLLKVLPEFTLIGFIQLFFLVGLVIFYSFHIN